MLSFFFFSRSCLSFIPLRCEAGGLAEGRPGLTQLQGLQLGEVGRSTQLIEDVIVSLLVRLQKKEEKKKEKVIRLLSLPSLIRAAAACGGWCRGGGHPSTHEGSVRLRAFHHGTVPPTTSGSSARSRWIVSALLEDIIGDESKTTAHALTYVEEPP